jgi:hypothetical protein
MIDEILKSLLLALPVVAIAVGFSILIRHYNPDGDKCLHGLRHDVCEACRGEWE